MIGNLTGLPGDDEGLAAELQPRLPGGQGAAVRLGRSDQPRPRRGDRDDRHGDVDARADAGRRRRRGDRRRPTSPSGWCSVACRSATRTPSSARWCAGRWPARRRWLRWSPPTRRSVPTRRRSSPRVCRSRAGSRRAAPVPCRSPMQIERFADAPRPAPRRRGVKRARPVAFFDRDSVEVAPELLNKLLVVGDVAARITEVEAYTQDDPASHCYRGPHQAQRGDVRSCRASLRVLRLRDAPLRQHRDRAARAMVRPCCSVAVTV